MPVLNFTDRVGQTFSIIAPEGESVMEAIRETGEGDILALCGGSKSCATCHVYVEAEWFGALVPGDPDEDDLLDSSDARQANSRLSCQIHLTPELDGLSVTIAPE